MDLVSSSNSVVIEDLPNELPTAEDVDALLNSEMCQLSLDERNKVYQDIHGVSDEINETPDLVAKSHHQLDLEIEQIKEKTAYDLACSIDRNYVMDKDFRMRFLRSTLFDAKAAATKMVQFFEMKRDLFGQGKLARDITQNDLSREDLIILYSGYQQYLPVRDSAGRAVAVLIPQDKELDSSIDPKNLLQHKVCQISLFLFCSSPPLLCVSNRCVYFRKKKKDATYILQHDGKFPRRGYSKERDSFRCFFRRNKAPSFSQTDGINVSYGKTAKGLASAS